MQTEFNFKAQDKSNAKRFLVKTCKIENVDDYLTQRDGAWGTWVDNAGKPVPFASLVAKIEAATAETTAPAAPVAPQPEPEAPVEEAVDPAASAFGAFALGQLTSDGSARVDTGSTKANTSTGLKIQKDRPEANGVIRPSKGTVCDQVWDLCEALTKTMGATATLSTVVEAAKMSNINQFTARTQYARWRKFIGATGRLNK